MNKWIQFAALSLVLGAATHPVKAAPAPAPGQANALTDWKAFQSYGYPSSLYLDGKGGRFLIYTLKGGRRLMIKLMPNRRLARADLLPPDWKPARGGQEIKLPQRYVPGLRSINPQAIRPPTAPHDRYHPGVKLLAQAGQK